MLGTWNTVVQTPFAKMKFVFVVEKEDQYTFSVKEPAPLNMLFQSVMVEGEQLHAKGKYILLSEETAEITLTFREDSFNGSLNLHSLGNLQIQGEKGEGISLVEALMSEVEKYRKSEPVVERTDQEIQQEVDRLVSNMSVQEKIGQMSQCLASNFSFGGDVESESAEKLVAEGKAGSILGAFDSNRVFELQKIAVEQSRLGIPLLFNADIIHGHQTVFPVPLAWSSSWDMDGIKRACAIAAKEASASGITYNHGPMVDVTRDARWGRVVEGAGEDPYLGSLIAKAQVEGFQGESLLSEKTIIACLKHFIAYGAAEGGRDYNTVDISEGTLRNVYLAPFKAGLEAGAGSVMNSFNVFQGVPVAGNKALLKNLLRDELGFNGILISDYGAVDEIAIHGAARDQKDAAKMAVDASMDIEMVTTTYSEYIPGLIEEGRLQESQLDEAVKRILTYKFKIGIMDDPFRYIRPDKEEEYHFCQEHLKESRELAKKSIVLLKNNGVLPLNKENGKIAVIGPFANSKDLLGPWQFSRYGDQTITLLEGLKDKAHNMENLLYAEGCKIDGVIDGGFEEALLQAKQADIVVLALGENSEMSGEAASRMDLELPEVQRRLAEEMVKLGKPTVLVLTNGRPLVLDWFERNMDAIVETWFLGSEAGHAIANVLFGDYNPSGKLTMSFPYKSGQVPVYYNHFKTGRPLTNKNQHEKFISKYLDGPNEPLYPFGYGLSYTDFSYSEIELDKNQMIRMEEIKASVTVTNTGNRPGEEVVQFYIQDLYGSVVRPVKELKGFKKIFLNPGESERVTFTITDEDLKYYTSDMNYKSEEGEFKVYIGTNSKELEEAAFELVG
ncbi:MULTISPECIES: glycoside hydrolase family 3 N-terminal domain-containing protein [unclassified Bacillus (in: firmicutes)]|uniref:glycoside hydrolase family 3 N-terminal domain-containing protein n=1 Tax=unclassified Bacillus (in: firmicutes) TaxID=185979 RepID=UPI001BE83D0F|nr:MULTISPECIES: glycoside hydrolase family 3 N-terminal domain-containing protein [unclassified Bacillus (in: firmicutes)]MBT2723923.1 glycoside hydrolase family 3 C-terminal domain-containing protein [Bacillus sp. ISL-46]MBT2744019.1 glycoside hydrolase family 3 C-terminal domain-containing protein [Bacillus sp. ISL-77]